MSNRRFLFLLAILIFLVSILIVELRYKSISNKKPIVSLPAILPTPKPAETTVQDSGAGKYTLTLVKKQQDDATLYSFRVTATDTKTTNTLFEQLAGADTVYSAPFNSFSPDDNQLFIRVMASGKLDYYVFNRDGSSFKDGAKYIDFRKYWDTSKITFGLKEITGWAAKDLLIVTTTRPDGSNGPSYWFVVSTRKFMQLAH